MSACFSFLDGDDLGAAKGECSVIYLWITRLTSLTTNLSKIKDLTVPKYSPTGKAGLVLETFLLLASLVVHGDCYNRIQYTGWFTNSRNVFSWCWRLGILASRCWKIPRLGRPISGMADGHLGEAGGELLGASEKGTSSIQDIIAPPSRR